MRARYPEQWYWTPEMRLAAAAATALSDIRYLTAAQLNWDGEIPDRYLSVMYGPPTDDAPESDPVGRSVADVRADADLLRAELGLAA